MMIDTTQSRFPTEAEIQRIMQDLKLDRVQAYNHVRGQILLREMQGKPRQ